MKLFATTLVIALTGATTIALPAHAALTVGTKAPPIETQAARGGKPFAFSLAKALKKGPVVVYFFPAAFTKGCTVETHAFADAAGEFEKNGATLIGLSADPIEKLQRFSIEACRNRFPVGVASPTTVGGYDVPLQRGAAVTSRTSYVIGRDGRIAYVLEQMNPVGHVQGTLDAVKAIRAKRGK